MPVFAGKAIKRGPWRPDPPYRSSRKRPGVSPPGHRVLHPVFRPRRPAKTPRDEDPPFRDVQNRRQQAIPPDPRRVCPDLRSSFFCLVWKPEIRTGNVGPGLGFIFGRPGRMLVKALGLIRLVDDRSPELGRSAFGRCVAEMAMIPGSSWTRSGSSGRPRTRPRPAAASRMGAWKRPPSLLSVPTDRSNPSRLTACTIGAKGRAPLRNSSGNRSPTGILTA